MHCALCFTIVPLVGKCTTQQSPRRSADQGEHRYQHLPTPHHQQPLNNAFLSSTTTSQMDLACYILL